MDRAQDFWSHDKLIISEEPADPELNRRLAQFRRNGEWLTEHDAPLFEQYFMRDVTNNFDVIYSHPQRQVTLLSPPHRFRIYASINVQKVFLSLQEQEYQ